MKKDKTPQFFLMIFCIILLAVIYTAFDFQFNDTNNIAYNSGEALGAAFANVVKILGTIGLCYFVYRKFRAVSKNKVDA